MASEHEERDYSDDYYDELDDEEYDESFDGEGVLPKLTGDHRSDVAAIRNKAAWATGTASGGGADEHKGATAPGAEPSDPALAEVGATNVRFAAGDESGAASASAPASDAEVERGGAGAASSPSADALDEDVDVDVDVDVDHIDVGGDHYDLETLLDQRDRLRAEVKGLGQERTTLLADVSRVDAQLGALRQQTRALESRGALAGEEIAAFAAVEGVKGGGGGGGGGGGARSSQQAAERVIELRVLIKELRSLTAVREAELEQARELRSSLEARLASCRAELAAVPRRRTVTAGEGRVALLALIDEKAALQQRALDRVTEAAQARRAAETKRSELEARLDAAVDESDDLQADAHAWERKCVAEQAVLDELGAQARALTAALSGFCDGAGTARHSKALRVEFDRFAQQGGVAGGTRLDAADVVPALLALVDGDAEALQAAADAQRAETEMQHGGGDGSVGFPEFCVLFSRVLGLGEKPEG